MEFSLQLPPNTMIRGVSEELHDRFRQQLRITKRTSHVMTETARSWHFVVVRLCVMKHSFKFFSFFKSVSNTRHQKSHSSPAYLFLISKQTRALFTQFTSTTQHNPASSSDLVIREKQAKVVACVTQCCFHEASSSKDNSDKRRTEGKRRSRNLPPTFPLLYQMSC